MITNKEVILQNVKLQLNKKTNKKGVVYYACDLVLENGESRQIGFAIDFHIINKLSKKGVSE